MTPTDVLLTPWTAARMLASTWERTSCSGCAQHQTEARKARIAAARAHEHSLALEQRLDTTQREIERYERDIARTRPHLLKDVSV